MDFYSFQRKLSQIEKEIKSIFASLILNGHPLTLSGYADAIYAFINDFDIVKYFGEDTIDCSYLECRLHINERETGVEFEWSFQTADNIDESRNMIYLNLVFADRYPINNQENYHYHWVAIERVYKVQHFGENVLFEINWEASFQSMISDIHYQAMKDEEPIAMVIYRYSDN